MRRILAVGAALALSGLGVPAAAPAAVAGPRLGVVAAVLIDRDTGQLLVSQNGSRELPIASTTKLMTALVTVERAPRLSRVLRQNDYRASGADSQIALAPGERMSVHDLLIALMLPSADDAAEDLAFNLGGGSVSRFIGYMNLRARELGLTHTHYSTPSGLDTPGNHSSAVDLVRLARFLLDSSPFIARVVALPQATLRTGSYVRRVLNRNDLVGRYRWVDGVKTGHTRQAGYVLVGSARRPGLGLISVVLGTPSLQARDAATLRLLRYGFSSFVRAAPLRSGQLIARPAVRDEDPRHADVVVRGSFATDIPRGAHVALVPSLPQRLRGPRRRGTPVGTVTVTIDGRPAATLPLVLARAIPPPPSSRLLLDLAAAGGTLALLLVLATGSRILLRRARTRPGR